MWNQSAIVILNGSSRINQNVADDGGGIFNAQFGTVSLNETGTITGNEAKNGGGGVSNEFGSVVLNDDSSIAANIAGLGGGVHNFAVGESAGSVTPNDRASSL